ncbi:hypothetical protein [Selenomonas ruminantium]|uniref:DUF115 domain-containing protein n=1 Tax=Selenomonas ruminantium TaxID=971 RepID=A0A1K1NRB7_SELRU|nr:hypothetical protein [Selenomonas ruminantium]SFW36966.1 hypothetical protein SAMN02910323_1529 [Selenomonas ruminantium]
MYGKIKWIIKKVFLSLEGLWHIVIKAKSFDNYKIGNNSKIYILGNGPSLRNELDNNLNIFSCNDCLCVNWFPLTDEFFQIKPSYLALADPVFFADGNIGYDFIKTKSEQFFHVLSKQVDWELVIIIPAQCIFDKRRVDLIKENSFIKIMKINADLFHGFDFLRDYFINKRLSSFHFQNVLVLALTAGIFMGYKQIFLLGCDHDWCKNLYVNDCNDVYIKDIHFYKDKSEGLVPMLKRPGQFFSMSELFNAFSIDFVEYEKIEKYARRHECEIINTVENSFIDAFKRGRI